jgi:hypothetical protein
MIHQVRSDESRTTGHENGSQTGQRSIPLVQEARTGPYRSESSPP